MLEQRLKDLKLKLGRATTIAQVAEIATDIDNVQRAIDVDAELRQAVVPTGTPCGASAAFEREKRTRENGNTEAWVAEAKARLERGA